MSKQILIFFVSAIAWATPPAFGMYRVDQRLDLREMMEDSYSLATYRINSFGHDSTVTLNDPQDPPQPSAASIKARQEFSKQIDELLQAQTRPFNGAILIAKRKEILFKKAMGEKGAPTFESQFIIGSISKQITAATVLCDVQNGLLNLHTPIKAYLPDAKDSWVEKVTLHHLLNHTSGIKALGEPLEFEPGSKFSYSNVGYDLLGTILGNVREWASYNQLAELTFSKASMHDSFAPKSGLNAEIQTKCPHFVEGYLENESGEIVLDQQPPNPTSNPSGGLVSTVHDLLKWNLALHGGQGQLLKKDVYQQMITPTAEREHRWGGKVGYGYGIHINNANNIRELSHGGIVPGYLSTLIFYPDFNVSFIILENKVLWTDKWTLDDLRKAFETHDKVREIVRKDLSKF